MKETNKNLKKAMFKMGSKAIKKALSKCVLHNVRISFFNKKTGWQTCLNCKYNLGESCGVGTVYAEKGINAICYEGELWEKNER